MQFRSLRIGIAGFLWFTSALAMAAIIALCAGSLHSMRIVGQQALEVRQVKLPEVEETQRSLINIESLRRLAEVVYISNDSQTRRMARIRAQAMSTESVFTRNSVFYTQSKHLIDQINTLASIRDKERSYQQRMSVLQKGFMTSMFTMAFLVDAYEDFVGFIEPALPIVSFQYSTHDTARESIARNKRAWEANLARFQTIERLCMEQSAVNPAFALECARQKEFQAEYVEILQSIDDITSEAFASWQSIDDALREMRDVVRTDAEFETKDALTSIENTSKTAINAALWLAAAGVVFFMLYLGVLHCVLVRPVRWAGRKLLEIQQGVLDTPAPAIHITELYQVGDLLDRFSAHIAELTSQASQLAEDAAEKQDLEHLMAAVFRLSVDGYMIWSPDKKLIVNAELLRLLGFSNAEAIEAHWQEIGFLKQEDLPILFAKIQAKGSLRSEVMLTSAQGEHIPFEVSYVPLKRQNGISTLAYFRDLRPQKLTEEALRTAKDRAEEAARVKSDFLARMSHEIRTPMNGVLGLTDIAMRESPPPAQKVYLEKIQGSARILLRVINDILDFSKMESGNFTLENRPFSFVRMLNTATDLFTFQAKAKGLYFTVESSPDIPEYVIGDELRLSQVLLNLCGNAMKFTEHGGVTVRVVLDSQDATHLNVRFFIMDTDIGMNAQQVSTLFQPFVQADSSTTRKYGGTGLGLVISSLLVKMMRGSITVASIPGEGSTFCFNVLLEKHQGHVAVPDLTPEHDTPAESLQGLRVLLVEDNEINQEVAMALLEDLGCTVTVAANGREALDLLENITVDCILMDIQMPVMDGLSATRIIRQDTRPAISGLPIIAMTAHAMQEDRDKSIQAGMNMHITKPIDFGELRAALWQVARTSGGVPIAKQ